MTQDQIDGLTKARLASNIMRASTEEPQFTTNEEYATWVCATAQIAVLPEEALNSYAENWATTEIGTLTQALLDILKARQNVADKSEEATAAQARVEQAQAAAEDVAAMVHGLIQS